MVNVGFAYIERLILEQFIAQVKKTEDEGCKMILTKLCQLFALSQMEKNKGWYLEHDYMAGAKTKAIRKMINQLCLEVRENAVPLVMPSRSQRAVWLRPLPRMINARV